MSPSSDGSSGQGKKRSELKSEGEVMAGREFDIRVEPKRRDRIVVVYVDTPLGKLPDFLPWCCVEADREKSKRKGR